MSREFPSMRARTRRRDVQSASDLEVSFQTE